MINPVRISSITNRAPEGFSIEKRRSRNTAALAIAVAQCVPIPSMRATDRRGYFYELLQGVRNNLFKINEVCCIDVDRVCEVGYRIWAERYIAAHSPFTVMMISKENPFRKAIDNNIIDFDQLMIDSEIVADFVDLIRDEA